MVDRNDSDLPATSEPTSGTPGPRRDRENWWLLGLLVATGCFLLVVVGLAAARATGENGWGVAAVVAALLSAGVFATVGWLFARSPRASRLPWRRRSPRPESPAAEPTSRPRPSRRDQ